MVAGVAPVHTGTLYRKASQGGSKGTSWVCVHVGIAWLERYRRRLKVFQKKKNRFGLSAFSGSTVLQFLQHHPTDSSGTAAGFYRALSLLVTVGVTMGCAGSDQLLLPRGKEELKIPKRKVGGMTGEYCVFLCWARSLALNSEPF